MPLNIYIADDHQLFIEGVKALLRDVEDIKISGEAENGEALLKLMEKEPVEVVLMDINMEPMNGIDATRAIREFSDDIKIIGISIHTDLPYFNALIQAGANGYVTKNSPGEEMVKAILLVMQGEKYFCREIADLERKAG